MDRAATAIYDITKAVEGRGEVEDKYDDKNDHNKRGKPVYPDPSSSSHPLAILSDF